MSLQEDAARVMIERAQRRERWPQYASLSIEVLDELEQHDPDQERRQDIREFLLYDRRAIKARLEEQERRAEYWEKSATPIAAVVFGVIAWFSLRLQVPAEYRPWSDIASFVASSAIWLAMRLQAYRSTVDARRKLTHLGKVD